MFFEYTAVPLAPPAVAGLFNLRGQVIAAVDLRVRLGRPARVLDGQIMNVIIRAGDGEPVSLVVDRIGDVVEPPGDLEPLPDTVSGPGRDLVLGTLALDVRMMLELDVEKAIDINQPEGRS
jgi:purine-binding chemotaxis protein CheW